METADGVDVHLVVPSTPLPGSPVPTVTTSAPARPAPVAGPGGGPLPRTGLDVVLAVTVAVVLLAVGTVLLAVAARRRRSV